MTATIPWGGGGKKDTFEGPMGQTADAEFSQGFRPLCNYQNNPGCSGCGFLPLGCVIRIQSVGVWQTLPRVRKGKKALSKLGCL